MHENREISSTPWSDDQGRSAKATSRNADMHVPEKSDCVVQPVNRPNKEGQPSAEVGEGRAQTKENIVQSHMHPTQSGKRMSQGLDGVRKVAKERKQERFTALLHHLNVDLLRDSFYALQRKASPGIDGVTWQEYETGLEDRLVDLHSRVHRGAYRAKPSRRVFIPKADGRQRPLGIAALEDKVVQQAVVTILNQDFGSYVAHNQTPLDTALSRFMGMMILSRKLLAFARDDAFAAGFAPINSRIRGFSTDFRDNIEYCNARSAEEGWIFVDGSHCALVIA